MGIRGKMLSFVKRLYRDNKVRVRAGGHLSDPFDMITGNRQGCPLSPLLFIIFINGILKECSVGGVKVPAVKEWDWNSGGVLPMEVDAKCAGFKYADNVILLEESAEKAKEVCKNFARWVLKWGMELAIARCGVICWTEDEEI